MKALFLSVLFALFTSTVHAQVDAWKHEKDSADAAQMQKTAKPIRMPASIAAGFVSVPVREYKDMVDELKELRKKNQENEKFLNSLEKEF